jgi:putative IMPACT (imprinted ancient) family translation regulator
VDNINLKDSALHTLYKDKLTARATHNIWPLRIRQMTKVITTWEDDGEFHAGRLLSQMLEESGAMNQMLIVTRWYGGSHMGNKRFDCIREVATQALSKVHAELSPTSVESPH